MLFIFVSLFTIVVNILIGIVVFSRAPHERNNQKFALLCTAIVGWTATLFIYYSTYNPFFVLLFGRLTFFFAALIPVSMFSFVYTFPKKVIRISPWLELLVVVHAICMAILSLTPFIDAKEIIRNGQHVTLYGQLYAFYFISLIVVCFMSIGLLLRKFFKVKGMIRMQLQYLLLGLVSFSSIVIICNGILPALFHSTVLDPFGWLATVAFLGFIFYAMVRHRFMDINRIAAGTGVYVSSILALGSLYAVIAYGIGIIFFPDTVDARYIIITVLLSVGTKYAISPIRSYFWKVTNKFFYNNLYDREEVFNAISETVVSSLYLDTLIERTLAVFCSNFIAQHGVFIATQENNRKSMYITNSKRYKFSLTKKELHLLDTIDKITLLDEIEDTNLFRALHKKNIQLVIPITIGKKKKGFFLLEEKISGAIYSEYDMQTLAFILPTISIALQNASSIERIKGFNKQLKKEIDKSTRDLRRVNDRLRMADTLKDEFISIASHELKTPTTAIQGFLWLVLQKDKKLSSYSKEKLEKITQLTHHITSLVNDMLDVSKIESKRVTLRPEPFDIAHLVEEIKGELDVFAMQKDIDIHVKNGKPYNVWADRQRMRQVVSNLMNNSLKYTLHGGKISIYFRKKNDKVVIAVTDTGIGIRESDLPKLFTKFGKLDDGNSVSSHLPGSGLGLYISKNFVELSGGEMDVDSSYGKGSTFTFSLPIHE